ncbi:Microtubule-associated protein [Vigna angularis]|uniref:Microtubule-associated protein n=1 Tax=Phaseolus angularis TaxID=3914 RepID=A0A8T0K7G2_PHAAN|nr:Microtubule-associated protein [Vigna angularis]
MPPKAIIATKKKVVEANKGQNFSDISIPEKEEKRWERRVKKKRLVERDGLNLKQSALVSIEKAKELATCQSEIKVLKATEAKKDKAIEELRNEVSKLEERLRLTQDHLKHKKLEIKKLTEEKKDALAAQYAAEATLRRLHADQKEDDFVPLESVITPLEAEIKMFRNEIAALQEDKKALERLTKSKEAALLEAEKILRTALERVLIVEEEENKILEKTHRQKILEVEKLSQTIHELEEVILSSGVNANAVRDYQRQISELQEEKRTLERELARVKVSANRVATVVANEWKDENDKVMPVKQWLEERRIMQAEMQRLKEKLAISERTAKAESQLKDKLKLRLKTVEEGLKHFSNSSNSGSAKAENILRKKCGSAENMLKKGIWASRNKVVDSDEKENKMQVNAGINSNKRSDEREAAQIKTAVEDDEDSKSNSCNDLGTNDVVSGFLYDKLQKEVINLRKSCEIKESSLQTKEEEIKMLTKKVDALTKAMEIEWKKTKREAAARDREAASIKSDDNRKIRRSNSSRRMMKDH